jgi:hypothetical protein
VYFAGARDIQMTAKSSSPPSEHADGTSRLVDVLAVVAREMAALVEESIRLQHLLGELLQERETLYPDSVYGLQSLDHSTQTIEAAAVFLDALSKELPAHWRVNAANAARCVSIGRFARVVQQATDERIERDASASGDCQLL